MNLEGLENILDTETDIEQLRKVAKSLHKSVTDQVKEIDELKTENYKQRMDINEWEIYAEAYIKEYQGQAASELNK